MPYYILKWVFAFILLWGICRISAGPIGYCTALMDVSRGHYEIKIYGLSGRAWGLRFSNLLKERYGIIYPAFAGCIVTDSEVAYKNAYNSVSRPGIIRHFGHDVFTECEQDAKTDYQKQMEEKDRAAKEKQRRIYEAKLNTVSNK